MQQQWDAEERLDVAVEQSSDRKAYSAMDTIQELNATVLGQRASETSGAFPCCGRWQRLRG